jgi:hypothetical protein
MNLDERRQLERLQLDFTRVGTAIRQWTQRVLEDGITQHPVFIATRQTVGLGVQVLQGDTLGLYWSFRMTSVEELANKRVVNPEQMEEFKQRHTAPLTKACVLLLPPGKAVPPRFVFIPFTGSPQDN